MISFKMLKYDRCYDAGFFHYEGDKLTHPNWHVGDHVSVMFEATKEQIEAVENYGKDGFRICDGMAHVRCVVLQRYHSVVWKSVGTLQASSSSVTLQATTGEWDDLLAWIITGKRPEWAEP